MIQAIYWNPGGLKLRPKVYIDGANIGHEDEENISGLRIKEALCMMEKYGFKAHVIFPSYLINGQNKNKKKKVKHPEIIDELKNEGRLSLVSNDDDEAIITIASDTDSFILTNDRYKDHKEKSWWNPKNDKLIKSNLITFDFIEDKISISQSERHRLNIYLNDLSQSQMSLSNFKKHATNGGVPLKARLETLPKTVQIIPELIPQNPNEISLAALGSELKNRTDHGLKDLFGNSNNAAKFLKSRGYPIRRNKGDIYVKAATA